MELIKIENLIFTQEQLSLFLPYILMSVGGMVTLLVGVIKSQHKNLLTATLAVLTIAASIFASLKGWGEPSYKLFNNMLVIDSFSTFFNLLILSTTGLILFSSYSYLEREKINYPELYSLTLFSTLGMMFLISSVDLITLFISLEVMSIGVYVLVGFRRTDIRSNEAAVKYFILGSVASAILLYGIALIYGATGSMNIHEISNFIKSNTATNSLFILGALLVTIGFLFKVAAAPFHMWMPDVYEGASISVTNYMTTGLKAAAFATFLRVFLNIFHFESLDSVINKNVHNILWVVALITMFIGNVVALTQRSIKRMLGYSSIAHTGYLIVGFLAISGKAEYGVASIVVYLVAYIAMNIGAFTIVALISDKGDANTNIEDYAGLGFKHPLLGFSLSVFMFSMAGIPPTAGFAGKYLLFSSAVQSGEIILAILAVLCSAISAYYYLRVIVYMYMKDSPKDSKFSVCLSSGIVITLTVATTLHFGIFPSQLIDMAKKAVTGIY